MTIRSKLIIAGMVLTAAVSYLAMAGAKSGWMYFLEVDRYLADAQYHSQRVRLHGKVGVDALQIKPAELSARFNLVGQTANLAVDYRGTIPELFDGGREVVVEGKRDAATGVFHADMLMTKCASKYEPNSPHKTAAGGAAGETATVPAVKERV